MRSRTEDIRLSDLLPSLSSDRTGRRGRLKRSAGTKARAKPPFPRLESHSTRFFREPEAFEALRKVVLPRITHDCAAQQAVRIWVPECSTGEEVYSIAMVLKEYLSEAATHVKTKIFGTDANDANVATARAAIYPLASVGDLSPTRVDRFFTKVEGGYRVAPDIREMCIFSCLDLINDLPFSHLDLISCRNRLPHLRPAWQKKILRDFHFALKPTGCLLLGNSESSHIDNTWHRLTDCAAQIYSKIKGEAYFRMSAQEVRKLWGRLLTTADDEDKKIARDLHDFFVPRLFGVEQRLKEAEEQLPWHPIHARKLREIRKEISEVAKAISTLSHTLHPAVVTQFGLVPALEAECAAFTRLYKIPVKLFADAVPQLLPENTALCLYRVVQEALQNVRKHADAPLTALRLSKAGNEIALVIQDFGKGFDLKSVRGKGGLGLVSMEERVRLVGGSLSVESKAGEGTRIEVCIPLPAN